MIEVKTTLLLFSNISCTISSSFSFTHIDHYVRSFKFKIYGTIDII